MIKEQKIKIIITQNDQIQNKQNSIDKLHESEIKLSFINLKNKSYTIQQQKRKQTIIYYIIVIIPLIPVKMLKHTQNLKINYDAIMKSIKIQPQYSKPTTLINQAKLVYKYIHQHQNYNLNIHQPNNNNTTNSLSSTSSNRQTKQRKTQQIYSSIVYDDLQHQSCFQSVCRQNNTKQIQFKLYDNKKYTKTFNTQTCNQKITNKSDNSLNKFKKYKNKTIAQTLHSQSIQNKQNNAYNNNLAKPTTIIKHYNETKSQHRYLSHTETSQNKLKPKINVHNIQKTPIKRNQSSKEIKKKKAGILIINQKYYNS